MKKVFILIFLCSIATGAQVGINTDSPEAMLDVNGDVIIRDVGVLPLEAAIEEILVLDDDHRIQSVSIDRITGAGGSGNLKSFVKGDGGSGFSVLSIGLLSGWQKISFPEAGIDFDENNDYGTANNEFVAPADGIYNINVFVEINSLITASTLGVGIFKVDGVTEAMTLLADESYLSVGINLGITLVNVSPPTRSAQTLVKLKEGDKIVFGARVPLLNIGIFTGSNAQFSIFQVK